MIKLYAALVGFGFAANVAGLTGLSLYVEPFAGDLTRIGGYLETEFGETAPQRQFDRNYYRYTRDYGDLLDGSFDVVVFGDSFSAQVQSRAGWQNFFHDLTGLSIVTYHHDGIAQLDAYVQSDAFQTAPPRLLVVQNVERNARWRLGGFPGTCQAAEPATTLPPDAPIELAPQNLETTAVYRTTQHTSLIAGLNDAARLVMLNLKFGVLPSLSGVREAELDRGDLFSSVRNDRLLYYAADEAKYRLGADDRQALSCSLLNMQAAVEANGYTTFILMVAPDKLSVYRRYLASQTLGVSPIYRAVRDTEGLRYVDLLAAFDAALDDPATVDLYMPNDTHWSSAGASIAAAELADYVVAHLPHEIQGTGRDTVWRDADVGVPTD